MLSLSIFFLRCIHFNFKSISFWIASSFLLANRRFDGVNDAKRRNSQGIKKERVPTFLIPLDGSGKPYQKNEEKQSTPYYNKVWAFAVFRPLIEFYQNLPVGTVSSNVLRKMSFRRSDAAKIAILSLPPQTPALFSRTAR